MGRHENVAPGPSWTVVILAQPSPLLHTVTASGFCTAPGWVIGHISPSPHNGRYFYSTLYGHHRHTHRLSNPRGQQAGRRTSRSIRCDHTEGRKSRERSHVQHMDNIGIIRTPVCSRGAAVHDAMAKAHALDLLRPCVAAELCKTYNK
jgi:hypothetical protein